MPVIVGLLVPAIAEPQSRLRFDHLTVEDGLSHNHVQAVLKDSHGFLWFGTADGANRYDGYGFVAYHHDPEDPGSLPSTTAQVFFEDSERRLWVGTSSVDAGLAGSAGQQQSGLALYDREHDRFVAYGLDPTGAPGAGAVRDIVEARDGALWLATGDGIARFDPKTGDSERFPLNGAVASPSASPVVMALLWDEEERLWVGSASGLLSFDPARRRYTRWQGDGDDPTGLDRVEIWDLLAAEGEALWIAATNGGLRHLDLATGQDTRYRHDPRAPRSISPGRVLRLTDDDEGRLYVAVENAGLNILDPGTGRFTRHQLDPDDEHSLNSSSIWALRFDDQGILWIGTFNGGVNFMSPLGQRFRHLKAGRGRLSNPHVSAILEDHQGDLWIGTDPGGLNRVDRRTGVFRYYRSRLDDSTTIRSDAVMALFQDRQNTIWLGGWDGGLGRINRATGRVRRYEHDPGDPSTIGSNHVWTILELQDGQMLIGTWHGADFFDRRTGRFTRLEERYPEAGTVGTYATAEDARGNIWLARSDGALYIDRESGRVTRHQNDPEDPQSLGEGLVQTLRVDSTGNVWLGTAAGLNCLPAGDSTMRRYTVADGLPHDSIMGILDDGDGDLWLGTSRGLVQFENAVTVPEKPSFVAFDTHDGLQGYEFVRNAAFRSSSGEMFFGGSRGLNSFFPDDIRRNETPPPVVLTDLRILNETVVPGAPGSPLEKQLGDTESLVLSHEDSVITIEFAALNYLLPQKNRYAYRLEGFDRDWNQVGTQRTATYTNLSPGSYTFRVRASNNDGVWNDRGVSLPIRVTPPLWATWWFRSLLVIGLVAGSTSWYRRSVRRMAERQRELETLVAERTSELAASAESLRGRSQELSQENEERRRAEEEARLAAEETARSNRELEENRQGLEREVAERKRAEEEAGRERDLLHALMDNTPDLIYFKDKESRFARVNRAMAAVLGVDLPEAAVGRSDADFFPPDFARATLENERQLIRSGEALIGHMEHDAQNDRWFLTSKVPMRDAAGTVMGVVGISKDITESKRAEQKLESELEEFLTIVNAVAQGDLTRRGQEGQEVLGRIASGFNAMIGSVSEILTHVRDTVLSVSTSSTEILAAATQIAKGAQHGSDQVNQTSAAVEEMAASMTQVAQDSDDSAGAANAVLEHVREGQTSMKAASDGMARIDSAVDQTAQKMTLLDGRSQEIFEVIDLIEEIAAQSELLSLNAAIQAAHAGEAGRGFSVVADEIRRLAERSKEASREVSRIVEGIVAEVRTVLEAMRLAMDEVKVEQGLSEKASNSLQEIEGLVARSTQLASQISLASREQADTTHTVSQSMQSIASITTESAAGARETSRSVEHLVNLSNELTEAIARFRFAGDASDSHR